MHTHTILIFFPKLRTGLFNTRGHHCGHRSVQGIHYSPEAISSRTAAISEPGFTVQRTTLQPCSALCRLPSEDGAQSTMHSAQLFFQWATYLHLKLSLQNVCVHLYCMCMNVFGHATVSMQQSEDNWKTQFSPSTRWGPRTDPGWSDLAVSAFTHRGIAPAFFCVLSVIWPHICEPQFSSSPELQSKIGRFESGKDSQYSP